MAHERTKAMSITAKQKADRASISLPMASDTARSEARFISNAAERVAKQLVLVEEAARDGQYRIRDTEQVVRELERAGTISHAVAKDILWHLLPLDEFAKIEHLGIFIERQLQSQMIGYRYICHTGIGRFLPDLYETQKQAIDAIEAKMAAKS